MREGMQRTLVEKRMASGKGRGFCRALSFLYSETGRFYFETVAQAPFRFDLRRDSWTACLTSCCDLHDEISAGELETTALTLPA